MSRRNKLQKFAQNLDFPNVYENFHPSRPVLAGKGGLELDLKGNWNNLHFQKDQPITLELACGRGEYSLDLARKYPGRHFIGVDVKGARIWKGAKTALEEQLPNVVFLRTRIEILDQFFEKEEVDEIWITFPDPFLKNSKSNRRLTADRFLDMYWKILKPGGLIHLKTDEEVLYEFTRTTLHPRKDYQVVFEDSDIYSKPLPFAELSTKTYYERIHLELGKTIKYLRFRKEF